LAALIVQALSAEIKPEVSSMISEEASTEDLLFPKFEYHLDESDPDIVLLRRQDDAFVAAFSARGALHTREGIVEAAKEDHRELVRVLTGPSKGRTPGNTGALKRQLRLIHPSS
jgi:hypothetical protein